MNNIICVNYILQNCLVYTIYNDCISALSLSLSLSLSHGRKWNIYNIFMEKKYPLASPDDEKKKKSHV